MKLLLTSAGLYIEEIVQEMERLVGKPRQDIAVAIISEAVKVEFGDRREWWFDELNNIRNITGGRIDVIDLQANDLETVSQNLKFADVIYVQGGNTDYLALVFRKTGFDRLLRELLETKVYVGSSAGSMVLGKRISALEYQKQYGHGDKYGGGAHYLEFINFSIIPHINNKYFPEKTFDSVRASVAVCEQTVYLLEDCQAVVVDGDELKLVGKVEEA